MDRESESRGETLGLELKPLESLGVTTNSFIVIIRSISHKPNDGRAEWRGSVEHSQSHERIYFLELSRLNNFISARSDILVPLPSWPSRLWQRWRVGWTKLLERLKIMRGNTNPSSRFAPRAARSFGDDDGR
jgi:hypothetical protein